MDIPSNPLTVHFSNHHNAEGSGQDFPEGHPGNREEGPLKVRFTDPPAEADDMILYQANEALGRGDEVVVVTSDRKLGKKVERAGARVLSTEDFFFELQRTPTAPDKEARFTGNQKEGLEREILQREESEESKRRSDAEALPESVPAEASREDTPPRPDSPPPAPPKPKEPSVIPRADRETRR